MAKARMKKPETFARQLKVPAHGAGLTGHVPANNYFAFTTLVA